MIGLPSKKPVVDDYEMNPACHLHPVHQPCCILVATDLLPLFLGMQFVAHRFLLHPVHQQICILVVTALLPLFLKMQFLAFLKMQLGETGNASLILVSQVAPPAYPFKEGGS